MTTRRGFLVLALVGALASLAGACKIAGRRQAHVEVGADATELRAAFNAAQGKVRLVVLVSPT